MATINRQNDLAIELCRLHTPGKPLVLTNVYDAATASIVANHPSTKAIATASYAVAAAQGIADEDLTLTRNLATVRSISAVLRPKDESTSEQQTDNLPRLPLTVDSSFSLSTFLLKWNDTKDFIK